MANMSYCRFQNTSQDLRACAESIDEMVNGEETLSRDELEAAKSLMRTAIQMLVALTEAAPAPTCLDDLFEEPALIDTILDQINEGDDDHDEYDGGTESGRSN